MDIVISFFRDTISGFWYFLYIVLCIFLIFVILGFVGDRKRAIISEKLKEKRRRDIESGKASAIAARESKQILDVMSEEELKNPNGEIVNDGGNAQSTEALAKKEEAPSVLVLGSDDTMQNPISNSGAVSDTSNNIN